MAERAAKDQPGRHDEHYYGAPTPAASVASGVRAVPTSQGSRSFAKGLARRRCSSPRAKGARCRLDEERGVRNERRVTREGGA